MKNLGIYTMYGRAASMVATPAIAHGILGREVGRDYGLTLTQKLKLLMQIRRNASQIVSGTSWHEHMLLVRQILCLPPELKGDVVECGCFKGSSTASLSLACRLTGRRLIVCDSFEGLPEIADDDRLHINLHDRRYETYAQGEYAGTLAEVRDNIREHGAIEVCDFVRGYFENTLPNVQGRFAFAFLDVDLHASLETCLRYLWPQIVEGGYLYTHEAQQLPFASLFFDRQWWAQNLNCEPPGLVGAGVGLPTGIATGSGIGYTTKLPASYDVQQDYRFSHFCGDPTRA